MRIPVKYEAAHVMFFMLQKQYPPLLLRVATKISSFSLVIVMGSVSVLFETTKCDVAQAESGKFCTGFLQYRRNINFAT
jgi:hypothetical protein